MYYLVYIEFSWISKWIAPVTIWCALICDKIIKLDKFQFQTCQINYDTSNIVKFILFKDIHKILDIITLKEADLMNINGKPELVLVTELHSGVSYLAYSTTFNRFFFLWTLCNSMIFKSKVPSHLICQRC